MSDTEHKTPRVFLSSGFKERIAGEWRKLPLRERILADHKNLPVELWAYELIWPEDSKNPAPDVDMVVDRCFAGVRSCDLFIFLLTERHGSGATYVEDRVLASYLELELFAAAILQKPVLVLHRRGQEPEPALRDTLALLRQTLSGRQYVIDDENGLYERFRQECDRLATCSDLASEPALARLPDWLARRRSHSTLAGEVANPSLSFLDGNFRSSRHSADPGKARLLLDQVARGVRGPTEREETLPHGASLFRLWAAMRELMDRSGSTMADPSLAPLWDRAFGMWASHASWFPLHGHLWMGPLASVHSQIVLRRKFADEPAFRAVTDLREPIGARASAVYSIAQRMRSRRQRLFHYRLAVALATQAIERDKAGQEGALLVRGYASMRLARFGYLWKFWDATSDFRNALALRETSGASEAKVGEAKIALGLASMITGRRRCGLAMIQDGVALMRSNTSASGLAFLARGLRHLEFGARIGCRPDVAEMSRLERLQLSTEIEAVDQLREP